VGDRFSVADIFPPIEEELGPYRHLFRGRVLNAGAGNRDISHLVQGELINQEIAGGLHSEAIDIYSPLHEIPVEDGHFDAVICNAVLEHVINPHEVMAEFHRVLRAWGTLYLTIPFMQPEHRDPTDFQRYTIDGIRVLCERHGFAVREAEPVHSVYTTLAWIVHEWTAQADGRVDRLIRATFLRYLVWRSLRSKRQVRTLASAHRVIAVREPGGG